MKCIMMIVISIFWCVSAADTAELWDAVTKAQNDGLPKTACEYLRKIEENAMKQKNYEEALKAVTRRITLEGTIEGNKPEEKITRIDKEILSAPPVMKEMLLLVQAKWFWQYYERNRWRFSQRSAVSGSDDRDFTTWDLPRLYKKVDELYTAVLKQDFLKNIETKDLSGFLEMGNMQIAYRKTLYDFAAHEALYFYSAAEKSLPKPEDAYEIDGNSTAGGTTDEFLSYNPVATDTESSALKVIRLYQQVISFNYERENFEALVDNDIMRIDYVRSVAFGQNLDARKERALQYICDTYPAQKTTSRAFAAIAQIFYSKGDYVKAREIAKNTVEQYVGTDGAVEALGLITEIESKSLTIQCEKVMLPDKVLIQAEYKNIDQLHFRIYKDDWRNTFESPWQSLETQNYADIAKMLKTEPLRQWSETLDPGDDYKNKTVRIQVPAIECGFYRIFASYKKDFSKSGNCIQYATFWTSRLALCVRNSNENIEGIVANSISGKPWTDMPVTYYERDNKGRYRQTGRVVTNADGIFSIAPGKLRNEVMFSIKSGDDELASGPYYNGYARSYSSYKRVVFFTDRSLYRPGQIIHFKGIVIDVNQKNNKYKTVSGQKISVTLRDANYQDVEKAEFVSNEFGSFSGRFTAPVGRVTGIMTLNSGSVSGSATIRVEEYKRPKFFTELFSDKSGARLGGPVKISGKASAYTGAAVDSAVVKYRVTRQAKMPAWWFWYYDSSMYSSAAKEICHGVTKTDREGNFTIEFIADPDLSIPESDEPTFIYSISADVTDSNGETRGAVLRSCMGYRAMELSAKTPAWIESKKEFKVSVQSATLDGEPLKTQGTAVLYALKGPENPVPKNLDSGRWWRKKGEDNMSDFRVWPLGEELQRTEFKTGDNGWCETAYSLKQGAYCVKYISRDRYGKEVTVKQPFLVIDPKASQMHISIPSVQMVKNTVLQPGDTLQGFFGTGYEFGRAYIEIEQDGKKLRSYWTTDTNTAESIFYRVDETLRGGFSLHMTYIRENRFYNSRFNISVPWTNKNLNMSFETFRGELYPAQKEQWTIKITGFDAQKEAAEMVASLYDESLDAFFPHSFTGFGGNFRTHSGMQSFFFINTANTFDGYMANWNAHIPVISRIYPAFPSEIIQDYYGYRFMRKSKGMRDNIMLKASAPAAQSSELMFEKAEGFADTAGGAIEKEAKSIGVDESDAEPEIDLSKVSARQNLNETAFFLPNLITDTDGTVKISFEMPEALTKWHFLGFAHTNDMKYGNIENHAVTKKDLMVEPLPPRFLREGDVIEFSAKVTNMTDELMKGKIRLTLENALTYESMDTLYKNTESEKHFTVSAHTSESFTWRVTVPDLTGAVRFRVVAATKDFSDGEEGVIPVLSRRILVKESIPLWIRDAGRKTFRFEKLLVNSSKSLENIGFTVQIASNPAWYAVQALPYLMEYPYECSEQTFNRLYANALAAYIANSDPKIKKIFEQWKGTDALKSNLEKNEDLKNVMLMETPWVLDAKSETEAKKRVGKLFDSSIVSKSLQSAMKTLTDMQLDDGAWPWFPGGRPSSYITLYITTGFGKLRHLGVDINVNPALKAINHLDGWIDALYHDIKNHGNLKRNNLSETIALYLYCRSFFIEDVPIRYTESFNYFVNQAEEHWLSVENRMSHGHMALALFRLSRKETASKIVNSLRERSVYDEELGMFWRETELSWWWYRAPIETQAVMIEVFEEVAQDDKSVDDCKVWLLKQKQTQDWKTTKATADAIYALILRGADLLASDRLVEISLGGETVKPENVEAGTGFYEKKFEKEAVKQSLGDITLIKHDKGIAWGGAYWQYLEDMTKITAHESNLRLNKKIFVARETKSGSVIVPYNTGEILHVGDLIKIRIELRTDRDMEFVHMKDMRGSGCEPVNVLSSYRYQDGLAYYESTKDTATHFFIDYLPKGTYVFEYSLRIQLKGEYQSGMAEIQCMYAPEFSSHSESLLMTVQ